MTTANLYEWAPYAEADRIRRLVHLAYNLRWTWEPRAAAVFEALAPDVWSVSHNPIAVLRAVAAGDARCIAKHALQIDKAVDDLEWYLQPGLDRRAAAFPTIAYLSAEFAVATCLPIYSGGLGVLAGDHLKSASDLRVPVIGIGLLYRYGYFRQCVDELGQQVEDYVRIDPALCPLRPVLDNQRLPCYVDIPFPHRSVKARAWRADIGRTRLYLLDTDLPENREEDRWITGHLYGGDQDTRLRQEMVLGIGGARLLRVLQQTGLEPAIGTYHLNEGHSALLVLELARQRLEAGSAANLHDALRRVAPFVAFTTHTSEQAGQDAFAAPLIEAHLADYRRQLRLSHESLMRLGRRHPDEDREPFSMTVLAMRGATQRNSVSLAHASISRSLWSGIGVGPDDRCPADPMRAITNGVHAPSWVGPDMAALYDRALGASWRLAARKPASWGALGEVPHIDLWQARTAQRNRLMQHACIDGDPSRLLVLGFARRFATYKRADLLFKDGERLARLLVGDRGRPVVIVFAGKAHPRDNPGKMLVQRVIETSRDARFGGRIVFVPDYDLHLAQLLVQGADVWLNTPRSGHEACGTSGMKAALNGALQLSELDGWWDEAYRPGLGWALGHDLDTGLAEDARDAAEAMQLMDMLEQQVVPQFYTRNSADIPTSLLDAIVGSIVALAPFCSAERMLVEYVTQVYRASAPGAKTAA